MVGISPFVLYSSLAMNPGDQLGPYEIKEPLGAGGMGEVYLAEDSRLGRKVAIKVLPEAFASDPERLARFEQEARAAAALNHPNIAVIHDIGFEPVDDGGDGAGDAGSAAGVHFMVQEFLEGDSLGVVLDKGAMPAGKALEVAAEVGEALTAAHKAGIIHRDLKPDNIFITDVGHAKVLDFGLAKLAESAAPASASMSPTMLGTVAGQVMGTAGYMAPEQIEATGEIDQRADLFSLGCVIYQMVSGRRPFSGQSVPDTLSQVLHTQPVSLQKIGTGLPAELERIVNKCLAKDRERRYQHADELTIDLRELRSALEAGTAAPLGDVGGIGEDGAVDGSQATPPPSAGGIGNVAAAAIVVVASALTGLGVWQLTGGDTAPAAPVRFQVETGTLDVFGSAPAVAVSPDGRTIVYLSIAGGTGRLMARSLDDFEARELPGTDDAQSPFFSPDGEWVGFFAGNEMRKVPLSGGAAQMICRMPTVFGSAEWGRDGTILFATYGTSTGVFAVSEDGGEPVEIIPFERQAVRATAGYLNPLLPDDSGRVLFQDQGDGSMLMWAPDSTETRRLPTPLTLSARYLPTGHLVWVSGGSLLAAPLDMESFELTASPVPVVEGVFASSVAAFAVSDSGTLAYVEGIGAGTGGTIVSVDRSGSVTTLIEEPQQFLRPALSPDGGSLISAEFGGDRGFRVFTHDLVRRSRRPVQADGALMAIWSHDGQHIIYSEPATSAAPTSLMWRAADGSGDAEQLGPEHELGWWPTHASSDGRWLAFYEIHPETSRDIWLMDLEDGENAVQPLVVTQANERSAAFSPDVRWIAYVSDESGRDEVYVMPAPPTTGPSFSVSVSGGREPIWSADGTELFYRRGDQMISVPFTADEEFVPGEEEVLFTGNFAVEAGGRNQLYGVTPDGQRFIMIAPQTEAARVNVVLNWFEELNELVPVGR